MIDVRSDTVTQPTPAMREAMANAVVGDDVFGEDPTVNRLEELAAAKLDKEAALFVSSGTMGNLVALLTHCGRGSEIILGDKQHTFLAEVGGLAALGGIMPHPVPNQPDGTLRLDDIAHAIRDDNVHYPRTRLIALENTHLLANGAPLPPSYLKEVRVLADEYGLKVHTDGARIFNAAVALNLPVSELARSSDTVQFCLSKGLSAPVGSMLVGPAAFIAEARRNRKMVGGGMRQAGVIAAAGIVALETMVDRLAEDHANAKFIAENLADLPGVILDPNTVKTNMVLFDLEPDGWTAPDLAAELERKGILIQARGPYALRIATHYGIEHAEAEAVLEAISRALKNSKSSDDPIL